MFNCLCALGQRACETLGRSSDPVSQHLHCLLGKAATQAGISEVCWWGMCEVTGMGAAERGTVQAHKDHRACGATQLAQLRKPSCQTFHLTSRNFTENTETTETTDTTETTVSSASPLHLPPRNTASLQGSIGKA